MQFNVASQNIPPLGSPFFVGVPLNEDIKVTLSEIMIRTNANILFFLDEDRKLKHRIAQLDFPGLGSPGAGPWGARDKIIPGGHCVIVYCQTEPHITFNGEAWCNLVDSNNKVTDC